MNISVEQTINGYKVTVDRRYDNQIAYTLKSRKGIYVIDMRRPEHPSNKSYIYVSSYLSKEDIMSHLLKFFN